MTTSMSPPDPPTRVKSESTSVATNHRWSAGQEGAGREVPRLWMSPSWGPCAPVAHVIKVAAEEHVLSVGDTDLRASQNTRGKPPRDASRGVAVHASDGPVPQSVEAVARRLRPASQVEPEASEKDTLGDAVLLEVTDPGVRLEAGRPHRHQLAPGLIAPHNQSASDGSGSKRSTLEAYWTGATQPAYQPCRRAWPRHKHQTSRTRGSDTYRSAAPVRSRSAMARSRAARPISSAVR